ncbi:MAG: YIP1 family protein [Phycisphaerae bacterium]|nr:YIP1 family protein [Phycisphaerae bacterium]
MYCAHCNYLLFNLTHPTCPECGSAFKVTDYAFEPGTVAFACPACRAVLPASGPMGLLRNRDITCPACHATCPADEVMVQPRVDGAAGVLEDRTGTARTPFESLRDWWDVCSKSMTAPDQLLLHRVHNPTGHALAFAMVTVFLAALISGAILGAITLGWTLETQSGVHVASMLLSVPFLLIGIALAAGILVTLGVMCMTASAHVVLVVTASKHRSFRYTFRTACYACGPLIAAGIPVIGTVVGALWGLFAFAAGLRAVHHVSMPLALIAAFWLPGVVTAMAFLLP